MPSNNRTRRAMKNAAFAFGSYAVFTVCNMVTRWAFGHQLGADLLGLEATFKNYVSMLSVAELGIGTGLVYLLYKPLIAGDRTAIRRILNFYQNAYRIIATIVGGAGLVLSLFATHLLNSDDASRYSWYYIAFTFFLYVCDTLASYLFANQRALIIADQKNYVNNINEFIMNTSTAVLQIALLFIVKSFVVYILVRVTCRMVSGFLIHRNFKRLYPDIAASKDKESLPKERRRQVLKNIRAMMFHKIGGFGVTAISGPILTKFENLAVTAAYSSYTLITLTVNALIVQVFGGITASFGDFLHSGRDRKAGYAKFNTLYHINYLIVSVCAVGFYVCLTPFIKIWMGQAYKMPTMTVDLLIVYFFINGMRRVIFMVRDSTGLYYPDRYMPLVEFSLNVGLSIILVHFTSLGAAGVVIGGIVSMTLVPFWIQPWIVHRQIFDRSPLPYFLRYIVYAAVTFGCCLLAGFLAGRLPVRLGPNHPFVNLLARGVVSLIVSISANMLIFIKWPETAYVRYLAGTVIGGAFGKFSRDKGRHFK